MKVCPRCSETNAPDAPICRRCQAALDLAPRLCPSARHLMEPLWTECAFCHGERERAQAAEPALVEAAAAARRSAANPALSNGTPSTSSAVNVPGFPGFPLRASAVQGAAAGTPSRGPAPQFAPGIFPDPLTDPAPARSSQPMTDSEFRRAVLLSDSRIDPPRVLAPLPPRPQAAIETAEPAEVEAASTFEEPYDPSALPRLSIPPAQASGGPDSTPPGGFRKAETAALAAAPEHGAPAPQPAPPTPEAEPAADERRIVGMLITYSWRPTGQIFPVREGRNLIGRDPARCEIAVPEDASLSGENSHITFRRNFVIGDRVSVGGTDLNDVPVEELFVPLPNYARIRTGSTQWIFVMVSPPAHESQLQAGDAQL